MKRFARGSRSRDVHSVIACGVVALGMVVLAQSKDSPDALLGKGLHLEEIEHNCAAAMKAYERVLRAPGTAQTAARAQLHIAACQEKLHRSEALASYQVVVSRYVDQPDVVAPARARIEALSGQQFASVTSRPLFTRNSPTVVRAASSDGRYVLYHDLAPRNYVLRDVIEGIDRPLPIGPASTTDHLDGASFSRDGRQLAYSWHSGDRFTLSLIGIERTKLSGPMLLQTWEDKRGVHNESVAVAEWSRDGRQIVVVTETQDASHHTSWQIVFLDTKDGVQRTVISREGPSQGSPRLSPDGKFLAYEIAGVKPDKQKDIAVVPVTGGPETPVVVDPASEVLLGWSPDGRHILFTSDRTGERSLYAVPFVNGTTHGAPRLLKRNFNAIPWAGVLGAGQLLYQIHGGDDPSTIRGDVKFAAYDFASERFVEPPVVAFRDTAGRNSSPDWSPDGQYLVSLSARSDPVLTVHSADGDYVRELRSGLKVDPASPWPRWMPDGKAVAVPATDGAGRQGIYRVDAQTGVASPLVLGKEGERLNGPAFSLDGRSMVYNRILTRPTTDGTATGASSSIQPRVIMERDLEHGGDRELMRGNLSAILFSPDGRYFTTARSDSDGCSILVVPAGGGEARDLMHAATPCRLWVEMWAPDSRSIFVADTPEPLHQFWRVSIADGARHSVNLDTNMGLSVRVHPDGRRLVYSVEAERTQTEVWVLENVLSALGSKK